MDAGGAEMQHEVSGEDQEFLRSFDECEVAPADFNHKAHLKLAYILLAMHGVKGAAPRFRSALQAFLQRNGIDPTKYHETMTQAWLLAVLHFMERAGTTANAEEFVKASPVLHDPKIMLTHYSQELIRSDRARREFVDPDLDPIPRRH
jgi:hypothetical protein